MIWQYWVKYGIVYRANGIHDFAGRCVSNEVTPYDLASQFLSLNQEITRPENFGTKDGITVTGCRCQHNYSLLLDQLHFQKRMVQWYFLPKIHTKQWHVLNAFVSQPNKAIKIKTSHIAEDDFVRQVSIHFLLFYNPFRELSSALVLESI